MVKADPKRNYYADLEVTADADAEEIRKQFRKLALKWHPDRNPGREAECVPRFQAIQAAHEILGDPAERQRYDIERRKRGGGGSAYAPRQPAPRGNPYQATSNFPPPPRRTAPGRAPPPPRPDYANPQASSGANRYTNFPKPPPTQRKENAAEQKANVFNAWQNMKNKPSAQPPPQASQADSPHQRAKSAWEYAKESRPGMHRSQSSRTTPKRSGFDPATPGADEPSAAGTSSYFTTSNYGRPVPPPPPRPRATSSATPQQHADPLKQFKDQFQTDPSYPEGTRTRTPYNSTGGEKIFVDPVRRSASQRSSPHRAPESADPSAHGASNPRHHSSSPPRRKGNATRPFSMYSSSEEDEPAPPSHKPSYTNRQGNAGANGYSAPNSANQESNANNDYGGTGPKSKPSMYDAFFPHKPAPTTTPVHPNIEMKPKEWPYWAVPSSLPPFAPERTLATFKGAIKKRSATNNISPPSHPTQRHLNYIANDGASFTFPVDPDAFTETNAEQFKSKSAESINTKFTPGDWHGKFEGKPDYFTGPGPSTANRARKEPSRPPSSRQNSMHNIKSPTNQSPPRTGEKPRPAPPLVKFSPDEWAKTFKDASFVLPTNPPPKSVSPAKGPPPMRGRKQSKPRTPGPSVRPKPASVADADEDGNESVQSSNEATATDGSAMDIDPTPPAPQTNGTQRPKIVPTPISQARAAQRDQAQAQGQGQAQEADSTLRFNDFANVAPFATTSQEGLTDLNDLTQNLPFESRPAATHPTMPSEPSFLRLPEMPKAPALPPRMTMGVWAEYLPKVAAYVRAFHQFDSHLLQHFAARQHETDALGTPVNWLGAMGDTTAGGFGSYMRGIKEDERARMHWDVAWEKHKENMELFEAARARVLKGGLPAA